MFYRIRFDVLFLDTKFFFDSSLIIQKNVWEEALGKCYRQLFGQKKRILAIVMEECFPAPFSHIDFSYILRVDPSSRLTKTQPVSIKLFKKHVYIHISVLEDEQAKTHSFFGIFRLNLICKIRWVNARSFGMVKSISALDEWHVWLSWGKADFGNSVETVNL